MWRVTCKFIGEYSQDQQPERKERSQEWSEKLGSDEITTETSAGSTGSSSWDGHSELSQTGKKKELSLLVFGCRIFQGKGRDLARGVCSAKAEFLLLPTCTAAED